MPPRKPARAPKPRAPKCSYEEDGRRCGKPASGNPPLCPPHLAILRAAAEAPYNPLNAVVDAVKNGRPVNVGDVLMAGVDMLGTMFSGRPFNPGPGTPVDRPPPSSSSGPRPPPGRGWDPFGAWQQQRQSSPPPPPPGDAVARTAARKTFGWPVTKVFTADELKLRYRELAKKHHPDRGGSPQKMAQVNDAMDVLTAELESR